MRTLQIWAVSVRRRFARGTAALAFGGALFFHHGSAHAEDPSPARQSERCDEEPTRRALALGASVVPGAIVHGSGHFVICQPETARRILFLEGVGAGSTLVSAAGLALTGASRYVVAPLAIGALGGLGLFTVTWLADVYGVIAPEGGFGKPSPPPRLTIQTGVRRVHDPLFPSEWLLSQAFTLNLGDYWVAPRLDASTDARHRRYGIVAARRLLAAHAERGEHERWRVDGKLAVRDFVESHEGFGMTSAEIALAARVDLVELGPSLDGSFAFAELGYSREWHRFDGAEGYTWDALLGRWGFGAYLGHGDVRGETWVAYDHRRDTVAGGLHVPGIPAGYAGFLEHRTELFFGRHFGAALELAYGSAAVVSAYLSIKLPEGGW